MIPARSSAGDAASTAERELPIERRHAEDLAISTDRLRKVFGDKIAVRGLTLQVRRGEVFGFLGPNGAGKSTSLKMLLGLVKPTSGSAQLLNRPIGETATRAKVGFLPEHFRFYDWLTAAELLRLHGQLCGVPRDILRRRIPEMLDTVGLTPHRGKQLRHFSKGMLQRIGLAQALINQPEVLFLDEPTSGLDPVGRRLVRDIIRGQRQRGTTVFLNSHLLSEVEVTCDRVAFIRAGEVIEVREMSSFNQERTQLLSRVTNVSRDVLDGLNTWATHIAIEGEQLSMNLRSADFAPRVLRYLVEHGAEVFEFTPRRLSLEDRFMEILGADQGL
ncbi:MAG: ABC transporter ATP-binding protein [Acidobacteriaceae bacterium]|nr:ABC transporter ATP-binding protein [Acidobacteriaceae bacterium]